MAQRTGGESGMSNIGECRRCKYECPISIDQLCYVCADEVMR